MFDPDDYELHEAQKHACKMARERDEARVMADRLADEVARLKSNLAAIEDEKNAYIEHACKMARERDEARVMADRLADELAKCAAVLPGVYYMDPPDGGDVSVSEQLRCMAKDAERYRLLRRKFAIISDGEGHAEFCVINLPRPTYIAPSSAIPQLVIWFRELDTALDRERLGLDGVRPPTPAG